MLKYLILLALTTVIFLQTTPAYCTTMMFHISATIPEHVMVNNNLGVTSLSSNLNQLVQTETVVRNHQNIRLTSIVVP